MGLHFIFTLSGIISIRTTIQYIRMELKIHDLLGQLDTFEGGDIVQLHSDMFFIGVSARTNLSGAQKIRDFIKQVIPNSVIVLLQIKSVKYYHLDTCFLPTNHALIVAEPLHDLFDKWTAEFISDLFPRTIVASHFTDQGWMCCNAKYFYDQNTLVTTNQLPQQISAILGKIDPDINVIECQLDHITKGGGGFSCTTLLDNTQEVCFLTIPNHGNLTKLRLNDFQMGDNLTENKLKHHQQMLMNEHLTVKQCLKDKVSRIVSLPDEPDIIEAIFIKDACVIIKDENVFHVCFAQFKNKERQREVEWLKTHLVIPSQEERG